MSLPISSSGLKLLSVFLGPGVRGHPGENWDFNQKHVFEPNLLPYCKFVAMSNYLRGYRTFKSLTLEP